MIKIVNIGMGAALGCIFAVQGSGYWYVSSMLNLGARATSEVPARDGGNNPPYEWFGPPPLADSVIFCHDVFGRRYRFLFRDGYGQPPEIREAQDCRDGPSTEHWWLHVTLWGPVTHRASWETLSSEGVSDE